MEQENRTVTISLAEYYDLIDDSVKLQLLLSACFTDSTLSYDGKALRFCDENINLVLRLIDSARHRRLMMALEAEKALEAKNDQA